VIPFASERRRTPQRAIVIDDSHPARAAWIRSILLPFIQRDAELHVASQRTCLRRRSDVLILADPGSRNDEAGSQRLTIAKLRYTLTSRTWQLLSSLPQGAAVTLLSGGSGMLGPLRNALDQLQRQDIQLTGLSGRAPQAAAWQTCRVRIQTRNPSTDTILEREIDPPMIAPGLIFSLARRSGRLDAETHRGMRDYLCRVAPVAADSTILLDAAFETKGCLDTAASLCSQVAIQLDDHDTIVDTSGPIELYLDGRPGAGVLGLTIGDLFPQLAATVAQLSGIVEQHASINGRAAIVRVACLARRPKRTLVILTRPEPLQASRGLARNRQTNGASYSLADIIGHSAAIERARQLALRAGRSESPVLIIGESGTGKELFAHAMHNLSRRATGPFVPVNCAAIPESLVETELFGYEDGAFTGASRRGRASLFERADAGTLFLDELADLSLHAQAALLRVLEEGVVTRVGGTRAVPVDVRVIGAVNRPLEDLVVEGAFRRDLYHRLCVIPLWIPPLSERWEDIPVLLRFILEALGDARTVPDEVLHYLLRYRWPGNVRELQHCLKYMITVTDDAFTVDDLPPYIQPYVQINDSGRAGSSNAAPADPNLLPVETGQPGARFLDNGSSAILALIEAANHRGAGIGRRALRDQMRQEGLALTERAIRKRLRALRIDGLIEWGLGRTGARLTAMGRNIQRRR
jgi:DNA-binding NtrC family response regulator